MAVEDVIDDAWLAEAAQERVWAERCGEPNRDRYPIRCKRDLGHETPHVGILGAPSVWPGEGNVVSAHSSAGWKCWCTPARGDLGDR